MPVHPPVFACGCSIVDVGQAFKEGVLVCPLHGLATAAYEHPPAPYSGRVRLELLVAAASRDDVQRWVDTLTETLLQEEIVLGLDCSETR